MTRPPRFWANNSSRLHLRAGLRAGSSTTQSVWLPRVASAALHLFRRSHPLQLARLPTYQIRAGNHRDWVTLDLQILART